MARPKRSVDEEIVLKAEEEFKKLGEGKVALRLRAIMAFGDNGVEEVTRILRVSPRSVFRWVKAFRENGIDGLKERHKGHYSPKLTATQKKRIKEWILGTKDSKGEDIHWTLKKLEREVHREFGVVISSVALWRNLRKMSLTIRKPRPVHAKADKEKQEAFKKKRKWK